MERLHSDIMSGILSLVPPESVLNCKLVCKTWRTLLSHFKVKAGLLFAISLMQRRDHQENYAQLYYGYYDDIVNSNDQGDEFSYTKLPKINLPPIKMWKNPPVMVGSCNGLVCFSIASDDTPDCPRDPVYVCNPFTGEYVDLPGSSMDIGHIGSGFGYLPKTNEYKVVRIDYPVEECGIITCGWVQVYTLGCGGGGWRNVGKTTHMLGLPGVGGDGVIHFMDESEWKLVTFDLADEEFRVPLQPPCLGSAGINSCFEVKVLGGHLYVLHQEHGERVDLWSFKKSNAVETDMNWSKEFSIPWNGPNSAIDYQPLALTRSNQFLSSLSGPRNFDFCCYNPETESIQTIVREEKKLRSFQTIMHMNSLVSPKDLGVQSGQTDLHLSICLDTLDINV